MGWCRSHGFPRSRVYLAAPFQVGNCCSSFFDNSNGTMCWDQRLVTLHTQGMLAAILTLLLGLMRSGMHTQSCRILQQVATVGSNGI